MQSFRTEIENPVVEKDIIELEKKIHLFHSGQIDEERFRSLRLARGVYGQRQPGVQMIRIKLPYGKVSGAQLKRIDDVSDEYSTGNLHITTRQDIQIHYVSLDRTPELWAELEKDDVTLREACGNTVRNVTASPDAGVNPDEPFDVTPYAHAVFAFFLRNPICQEMGRKFKISFSSSDEDTALAYIHDLGFIPKIKDGERGFRVMLGGGLGSQPRHADMLYDFLPENKLIPTVEAVLRVFDQHGERAKRLKARMKFLIREVGFDGFVKLIDEQRLALSVQEYDVDTSSFAFSASRPEADIPDSPLDGGYETWKDKNVIAQKQESFYSIGVKVKLGNFSSATARKLADLISTYANDELRFTLRQNLLIRNVHEDFLPHFYNKLSELGLANPGYESSADITACPGTDTCNLGIASSTGIADALEKLLENEYPQYINNQDIKIKISGCMNACGQHNMAHIGFQGMSIRTKDKLVAPALQVLLGGGVKGNGAGRFADKVIKIPSKRGPEALRRLLNDFERNAEGKDFLTYYDRRGKIYFYELLNDLSNTENLQESDFVDWGNNEKYIQAVGVGECAGVVIDLVQTLLLEAKEKLGLAIESYGESRWADSIYHTYSAFVNGAKAMLTAEDIKTNTQVNIINLFDEHFYQQGLISLPVSFSEMVNQMKENKPTGAFASAYLAQAQDFFQVIDQLREAQLNETA